MKELSSSTETELKSESEASRRKVEKRLGDSQRVVDGNAAKIDAAAKKVKTATSSSGKANPTATIAKTSSSAKTEKTAAKENNPTKTQRLDTGERNEECEDSSLKSIESLTHHKHFVAN